MPNAASLFIRNSNESVEENLEEYTRKFSYQVSTTVHYWKIMREMNTQKGNTVYLELCFFYSRNVCSILGYSGGEGYLQRRAIL